MLCEQKCFEKTAELNALVRAYGNKKKTPNKFMKYIHNHRLKTYGTGLETLYPFPPIQCNVSSSYRINMIKFVEALSRGVEETGLSIDTKDRKKANYGCKSRWKLVCSEARPYEPPFKPCAV